MKYWRHNDSRDITPEQIQNVQVISDSLQWNTFSIIYLEHANIINIKMSFFFHIHFSYRSLNLEFLYFCVVVRKTRRKHSRKYYCLLRNTFGSSLNRPWMFFWMSRTSNNITLDFFSLFRLVVGICLCGYTWFLDWKMKWKM